MNFEHIETAYRLILENIQSLQNQLHTNSYDALIEQNTCYLNRDAGDDGIKANNQKLEALKLDREEWRRVFQYLFVKLNQIEPLQYNHQFTPDSIGFLINFLIEELFPAQALDVIEIGSGTGNLAHTLLNHSRRELDYLGIELDDLLIDLAASIADVSGSSLHFVQGDAARPQLFRPADLIISDLPVGYYPDDIIASRFQVVAKEGHTYAHHIFMEQSLKYLKPGGYAIFLAPNNLLTSPQSGPLKAWLKKEASFQAMIGLPTNLFVREELAKSIFLLQKKGDQEGETLVYHLHSLQDTEVLQGFISSFKKWRQESAK